MENKCKTCEWYLDPCGLCKGFDGWTPRKSTLPTCPWCGGESVLKSFNPDSAFAVGQGGRKKAYWLKCKAYCPGEQNHGTPEAAIEAYGRRA